MFYECECGWHGIRHDAIPVPRLPVVLLACPTCKDTNIHQYSEWCTKRHLRAYPSHIFVFGDNQHRKGKGGAAKLRYVPNTYGFITKINPDHKPYSYYKPNGVYREIFDQELKKLIIFCDKNNDKKILLSKIGSGLANKYKIWEKVIEPVIYDFIANTPNVIQLWDN